MIVSLIRDRLLQGAVRRAAHPDEDVVTDSRLAHEAIAFGFPRLLIARDRSDLRGAAITLPTLHLDDSWSFGRGMGGVGRRPSRDRPVRLEDRLRVLIETTALRGTWVEVTLGEMARAAGAPLPLPFRAFARRILEFPTRYTDLRPVAEACGMSRGALKARFRRRGLASPYTYLRWLRVIAVAYVLSDRDVSVAGAAYRLGFTSDGNLCRTMGALTGLTPTEARTVRGWNRLLISFAWLHLTPGALSAWSELPELFEYVA